MNLDLQPIALDPQVLRDFGENWNDDNKIRFLTFIKNLRDYHAVLYDSVNNNSEWLRSINHIKESSPNQDFKDFVGNFFDREKNYIRLNRVLLSQQQEIIQQLTKNTPDKIGLRPEKMFFQNIRYYNLEEFISLEYDSKCRLLRIPKAITIQSGEYFSCADIFAPFVRKAKKLEFVDKFLFNESRVVGTDLMLSVINLVSDPNEIILYSGSQNNEELKNATESKLISRYGSDIYKGVKRYSGRKNHDRFIIIDDQAITIRSSNSFNNLEKVKKNIYRAIKSFEITFAYGRKYYD